MAQLINRPHRLVRSRFLKQFEVGFPEGFRGFMALVKQKGVIQLSTSKRMLLHRVDELMDELVRFRDQVDSVEAEEEEEEDIEDNDNEDEEQDE
jgi:hypothetical protein